MFVSSQKPCRQSDLFATLLLSMSAAKSRLRLSLEAKASKSSTFWDRIVSVLERHGVDEDNVDALDEVHLLQFGISAADAPMLALLLKGPPVLRFVFVHIILLFSFLFQCFAHLFLDFLSVFSVFFAAQLPPPPVGMLFSFSGCWVRWDFPAFFLSHSCFPSQQSSFEIRIRGSVCAVFPCLSL